MSDKTELQTEASATEGLSSPQGELKRLVRLLPTQGCYQKPIDARIVRETKSCFFVVPDGYMHEWKFNKADMLRTGNHKNVFPRYKLEIAI